MFSVMCTVRDHSFSAYAKFSEKLTGVRNLSFSENFAYISNKWFLICQRENREQKFTISSAVARKYYLEYSKVKYLGCFCLISFYMTYLLVLSDHEVMLMVNHHMAYVIIAMK